MALLAPARSPESPNIPNLQLPVDTEELRTPLDGGVVSGTLTHQGAFCHLAALVPGYYGIESAYKPLARLLSLLNPDLAVATFEPVRDQPQKGMFLSRFTEPTFVAHRLLAQTAEAVVEHVTTAHPEVKSTTLIGHSTGGPGALNAAKLNAKRRKLEKVAPVNNVILLASAGVTRHNIFSLSFKVPQVLWESVRYWDKLVENFGGEEPADFFMNAVSDLTRYVYTNPARTVGEGLAVGQCNAESSITKVRSQGTKVSGLFFDADAFFPGSIARKHIGHNVDLFRSLDQGMGHLAPQTHTPEVARELTNHMAYLGKLSLQAALKA